MTSGDGTTVYAFGLGLVAAVNPCGFPMLPAYLSMLAGEDEPVAAVRVARGLVAAALASTGFLAVFGLLGVLVEAGLKVAVGWVPWVMIPLGAGLVALGAVTAAGRYVPVPVPHLGVRVRHRRLVTAVGFGVSYAVASLSCALPLFLAGVSGSFTRQGYAAGVGDFVAYALGMGVVLAVLAVAVALGGVGVGRRLRRLAAAGPVIGGVVLVLVGAYLVYYWSTSLANPLATPAVVAAVEHVQSTLAGWLSASARSVGAVLGGVVAVALVVSAMGRRRPGSLRASPPPSPGALHTAPPPSRGTRWRAAPDRITTH